MKLTGKLTLAVICAAMAASLASCGTDAPESSNEVDLPKASVTTTSAETTKATEAATTAAADTVTTAAKADDTVRTPSSNEGEEWYLGDWYVNGAETLEMLRFEKGGKWSLYNDGGNGNLVLKGTFDDANPYALKLYDDYFDEASLNSHALVGEAHAGQSGVTLYVDKNYEGLPDLKEPTIFLRKGELSPDFYEAHDQGGETGAVELTDREALDELSKVVKANAYKLDGVEENNKVMGHKAYLFSVGESNEDQFVATAHYAVTIYGVIYIMDPATGEYVNYSWYRQ